MQQIPVQVIYMVICSEAVLAFIGVASLCATMFFKSYVDPAILTAIISITSGLVGSLGTLLASPRQPLPGTTSTTTSTVSTAPPPPPPGPTPIEVVNTPVPVTPTPNP